MKPKYDPENFPTQAEYFARQGFSDTQIAENLGIKKSAYYQYQRDHSDFAEAIKRGKKPVNLQVENALLKRALGYEYEETTKEVRKDESGNTINVVRKVEKHVPSDVAAMIIWLKNREPDRWRDKQVFEGFNNKEPDMSHYTYEQLYELKHGKKPVKL